MPAQQLEGEDDATMVEVLIRRIDATVAVPAYAHPGDAGADLVTTVDVRLEPGQRAMVPTGVSIALPHGYVALVHPRSGLAAASGLSIVNAPGTVDAGYRGEIKVTLLNTDRDHPVSFSRGDRIAQLVIQRVERALFHEVTVLPGSIRGEGGFGSTGGHNGNRAEAVTLRRGDRIAQLVIQRVEQARFVEVDTLPGSGRGDGGYGSTGGFATPVPTPGEGPP